MLKFTPTRNDTPCPGPHFQSSHPEATPSVRHRPSDPPIRVHISVHSRLFSPVQTPLSFLPAGFSPLRAALSGLPGTFRPSSRSKSAPIQSP